MNMAGPGGFNGEGFDMSALQNVMDVSSSRNLALHFTRSSACFRPGVTRLLSAPVQQSALSCRNAYMHV